MGFIRTIFTATSEQWKSTSLWIFYTLLGSLIPTWGGIVLLVIFNKLQDWSVFYKNGEFILYSAGLLAPALFVLIREAKRPGFQFMAIISVIMLLLTGLLYSAIALFGFKIIQSDIKINMGVLAKISLFLFVLSVFIAFLAELLSKIQQDPNVEGMRLREMNNLEDEYNKFKK
ncbi:hypothetical protein KZ483_25110 [Paenibacillus sp. sptzw28]|uniref:hypothetical protein n=1 Tax=Paenibacillus sp. sptzw28 TaxID=715179 RepID=UPI001C6E88C9|nr:hypothetical protein [Paenibacillus sp. sptzw28]QYR20981.1 hypothetical protein KZ483_25110 [Paenibacillus sp. sptzw28]